MTLEQEIYQILTEMRTTLYWFTTDIKNNDDHVSLSNKFNNKMKRLVSIILTLLDKEMDKGDTVDVWEKVNYYCFNKSKQGWYYQLCSIHKWLGVALRQDEYVLIHTKNIYEMTVKLLTTMK